MTKAPTLKIALLSVSLLSLSGCGLASLPGGYTPIEEQTVSELSGSNYTPRTADERAAIKTQELFAQAAFWSREYDLNPADLEAAINLASTLRRLGNPSKSVEITTQTRALYPRDVDLMTELAAAHISNNESQEAVKIIDEALSQRPQTARLWSMKGAVMDQMEDFTQARQYYAKAMQLAPNDSGIMANVGLSYALEGDPQTAEVWLRRAANAPGASPTVRQNLALVLGLQGKNEEAQTWASRDLDTMAAKENASYMNSLRGTQNSGTRTQQHQQTRPVQRQAGQRQVGPARTRRGSARPQNRNQQQMPQIQQAPRAQQPSRVRTYGYARPQQQRQVQPPMTQQAAPQFTAPKQQALRQQAPQPYMPEQQMRPQVTDTSTGTNMPQFAGAPKSTRMAPPAPIAAAAPMSVLDKIARSNQSKRALAQNQQTLLQARAQQRSANQYAAQQQAQQAYRQQPQNPMQQPAPQYQPYPQYAAPQQMQPQQYQGQADPRRAARSRRR